MGKKERQSPQQQAWSVRDSALFHTCEIAADLSAGRSAEPPTEVLTPFPPRLAEDEVIYAAGPFQLLERTAPGNGSYAHNGGFFFATGPLGMAATAAVAMGQAAGNSARRKAAQAQAVVRWMPIDSGLLYVSSHGFYMSVPNGLLTWSWSDVSMANMVGPCAVHLTGNSDRGSISWILHSDWAELVFLTWAMAVHPRHPQLQTGDWLPPGWLHWAAGQHRTRLVTPAITPAGG